MRYKSTPPSSFSWPYDSNKKVPSYLYSVHPKKNLEIMGWQKMNGGKAAFVEN